MKKILSIIIFLLMATPSFATDYYAIKSTTTIAANDVWSLTSSGSCTGGEAVAWSTVNASGNNLYANGCTALNVDANFNIGTGKISTEAGAGTAGGGFITTASTAVTVTANIVAGTTTVLTPVSSTGTLTWTGDVTGGAGGGYGVALSSSGCTFNLTGNSTGGSAVSATHGIYSTTSSSFTVSGVCTGGSYAGGSFGCYNNGTGTSTVVNCTGGSAAGANGCVANAAGALTVTGNITDTTTASGAAGRIVWSPAAATNFIKRIGDGTPAAYYLTSNVAGGAHPAVADVKTGVEYGWDGAAVYTGTLSTSGGGGAWGF